MGLTAKHRKLIFLYNKKDIVSTAQMKDGFNMSKERVLRLGVIGGGFGRMHILGHQACENVEVVAFCQRTKSNAEAIAQEFHIPHIFTDYRDLLRLKELDAISITAPPYLHHRIATEAMALGKHVLCEKPLAMNVSEAEDMYEKAKKAGVVHMTGFEWRFVPALTYMKTLVDQGYLGRVFHVDTCWFGDHKVDPGVPLGWRHRIEMAAAGVMADMSVHQIDMLRWIIGDFMKVCGHTKIFTKERQLPDGSRKGEVTTEDAAAFLAELQGGVQAIVHTSGVAPKSGFISVEIYGSKGVLLFKLDRKIPNWVLGTLAGAQAQDRIPQPIPIPTHLTEGLKTTDMNTALGQFLYAHISRRFVHGIREEKQPEPSFLEGLETQRVLEAVFKSVKEGRWIALD